ncbi:cobalt-precorrin-5B (C(1))-methyltransferase [Burkholderia pseudomallei]
MMRDETPEQPAPLRFGYTTGSCASATSLAAARLLLTGVASDTVDIVLPKGQHVAMRLAFCRATERWRRRGGHDQGTRRRTPTSRTARSCSRACTCVHEPGAARARASARSRAVAADRRRRAGDQPGAAMMTEHLAALAAEHGYAGGFDVAIGVENGEALARKTMNPRLGIVGGLSILGTTGIVRPFSCSAYIASIHQGIDVARANGVTHIAACTGNASEDAVRARYGLPDIALIEMGDFAGAVLKYLRRGERMREVGACDSGGFGKLSKLAAGHLDLHSRHSSIDLPLLAEWAGEAGASAVLQVDIRAYDEPAGGVGALRLAHLADVPLGDVVRGGRCVARRAGDARRGRSPRRFGDRPRGPASSASPP